MLTASQIAARDGRLTASRVACLMSGDTEAIYALWRELIGDPLHRDADLSEVWPVRLGEASEHLNLDWYTLKTGRQVTRRGEVVLHPSYEWAAATLDGWDDHIPGPVEAKHCGAWQKLPDIIARYQAQCHWQMLVTDTKQSALSIIMGAAEPVIEPVPFNAEYGAELWTRACAFWTCVETLTPPARANGVAAPVPPEKLRTVDMAGSNSWAANAGDWLANRAAAKAFEAAAKAIKGAIEPDVGRAHGHGIEATRAKNGNLTIRELRA